MPVSQATTDARVAGNYMHTVHNVIGSCPHQRWVIEKGAPALEPFRDELITVGGLAPGDPMVLSVNEAIYKCSDSIEMAGHMGWVRQFEESGDDVLAAVDWLEAYAAPIPQPPVNTLPAAQNGTMDTPLGITGISVADPDSANLDVLLETPPTGIMAINVLPGGAVITGNDTAQVRMVGTVAAINTCLALVTVTPATGFAGPTGMQITSDDSVTPRVVDILDITFA